MEVLIQNFEVVYAAVTSLVIYLSTYIPFVNKIPDMGLRALAIGVVLGVATFTTGLAEGHEIVFAFIGQALAYDKVAKPLGLKTKK